MSMFQKCHKCKKSLEISKFKKKNEYEYYSTCKPCRTINNKQSRESYRRRIDKKIKCEHCKKEYSKSYINLHMWRVHDIDKTGNKKLLRCDQNGCNYTCKINSDLNVHLWQLHDIDKTGKRKLVYCNQKECKSNFKTKSYLDRHLWQVHNIDKTCKKKLFKCNQEKCFRICKTNSDLNMHLWQVHNIDKTGKRKLFKCNQEKCFRICKTKSELNKHLWQVHNINITGNGKIFKCKQENCSYTCKSKSTINSHSSNVHDIGDYECSDCLQNVFKLIEFKDDVVQKNVKICRSCYNKRTGYSGKKEEQAVNFLEKKFGNYFVMKDKILKGDVCRTRRRPDLYISSSRNLHIIVECDENQHRGYNHRCENGRIDEMIDEIKEGSIIFIRWNPDYYKYNNKRGLTKRQERLELLEKTIDFFVMKEYQKLKLNIYMVYMFYSDDRVDLDTRFKTVYIGEEQDYQKLKTLNTPKIVFEE